jgi:hypothetical protein
MMTIAAVSKPTSFEMQECMQACMECYKICLESMTYCMEMGGKYMVGLMMRDCAEMCQMSVNMIMMGSEFVGRTCELCAEMCMRSAEYCDMMGNDPKMKACAECCRRCAWCCKQIALVKAA